MLISIPLLMSLLFSLRLSGSSGSFPKPLSEAEEREYVRRSTLGDLEARNILIERNLRLVAHIMKKGYPSRKLFLGNYGRNEV